MNSHATVKPHEAPIEAAFREWKAYADWLEGPGSGLATSGGAHSEVTINAHLDVCREKAERLCEMVPVEAHDLLLKLLVATYPIPDLDQPGNVTGAQVLAEIQAYVTRATASGAAPDIPG